MKSKPIVMKHFLTVHTSFVVDFTFTNNITILMGGLRNRKDSNLLIY